jgi:hypothetical protein
VFGDLVWDNDLVEIIELDIETYVTTKSISSFEGTYYGQALVFYGAHIEGGVTIDVADKIAEQWSILDDDITGISCALQYTGTEVFALCATFNGLPAFTDQLLALNNMNRDLLTINEVTWNDALVDEANVLMVAAFTERTISDNDGFVLDISTKTNVDPDGAQTVYNNLNQNGDTKVILLNSNYTDIGCVAKVHNSELFTICGFEGDSAQFIQTIYSGINKKSLNEVQSIATALDAVIDNYAGGGTDYVSVTYNGNLLKVIAGSVEGGQSTENANAILSNWKNDSSVQTIINGAFDMVGCTAKTITGKVDVLCGFYNGTDFFLKGTVDKINQARGGSNALVWDISYSGIVSDLLNGNYNDENTDPYNFNGAQIDYLAGTILGDMTTDSLQNIFNNWSSSIYLNTDFVSIYCDYKTGVSSTRVVCAFYDNVELFYFNLRKKINSYRVAASLNEISWTSFDPNLHWNLYEFVNYNLDYDSEHIRTIEDVRTLSGGYVTGVAGTNLAKLWYQDSGLRSVMLQSNILSMECDASYEGEYGDELNILCEFLTTADSYIDTIYKSINADREAVRFSDLQPISEIEDAIHNAIVSGTSYNSITYNGEALQFLSSTFSGPPTIQYAQYVVGSWNNDSTQKGVMLSTSATGIGCASRNEGNFVHVVCGVYSPPP